MDISENNTPEREEMMIRSAWIWPSVYLLLRFAAPFIPVPWPAVGSILSTVLFMLVPLVWLFTLTRPRIRARTGLLLFLLLAVVWAEIQLGRPFGLLRLIDWKEHRQWLPAMFLFARPVADLALITGAALLGSALATIIRDPKMLLPVTLVAAIVDYWGVYVGTTNLAIEKAPQIVAAVSASIPTFGGGLSPGGLQPASYIGFGDWFFLALFMTVAWRFDLQPGKTFWWLLILLIPAMLLVIFPVLDYLPALVPMAMAIFLVNGRRLKLSREEAFATVYGLIFIGVLIGAYSLVSRQMLR